jgi:hypothetical protein
MLCTRLLRPDGWALVWAQGPGNTSATVPRRPWLEHYSDQCALDAFWKTE